jgi:Tol biopolymer transport system component
MKKRILSCLFAAFLVLSGCARVVFVSDRDGRQQIYKSWANGNFQTNISNNSYIDDFPDLSPEADRIVFASFREQAGQNLYIMDLAGANLQQVTSGSGQRVYPRWSPNDLIAFVYPAFSQNAQIWTVKSDGTGLRQVTSPTAMESDGAGHDFYAAGQRLVFSRYDRTTQRYDLYTTAADGSGGAQRLTQTADISETLPDVSHDGLLLAFRAFYHSPPRDAIRIFQVGRWAMVREISLSPPAEINISGIGFSRDDQRLFFSAQAAGVTAPNVQNRQEVFSIKIDGTDLQRLTANQAGDFQPVAIGRNRQTSARVPVLFVHGHSGDATTAWRQPGSPGTTSFEAVLTANPDLAIDPVYLDLPVHGGSDPVVLARSIADDALDILAAIEGGLDSMGVQQTGILNRPEFASAEKVALVGYSQGAISSRYYLKNLMGTRRNGAITVSVFAALAAPNHGAGGTFSCGDASQPDRSGRELCAGRTATVISQGLPCGACPGNFAPDLFSTNLAGDETFLTDLNGHPFSADCNGTIAQPELEAPHSRPTTPGGVLYLNLYAENNADLIVGGDTQSLDCYGRRLARLHAPDAANRQISGVPSTLPQTVHGNFPHHRPTICTVLKTIVDQQVPAENTDTCAGLSVP